MKVKNDHRSKFSSLTNWKEEAYCDDHSSLSDREFDKSRELLISKRNICLLRKRTIIALMLRKNYPMLKKICCFSPVNLAIETPKTLQCTVTKRLKKFEEP